MKMETQQQVWPEDGLEICNAENRQRNPQGIIIPKDY